MYYSYTSQIILQNIYKMSIYNSHFQVEDNSRLASIDQANGDVNMIGLSGVSTLFRDFHLPQRITLPFSKNIPPNCILFADVDNDPFGDTELLIGSSDGILQIFKGIPANYSRISAKRSPISQHVPNNPNEIPSYLQKSHTNESNVERNSAFHSHFNFSPTTENSDVYAALAGTQNADLIPWAKSTSLGSIVSIAVGPIYPHPRFRYQRRKNLRPKERYSHNSSLISTLAIQDQHSKQMAEEGCEAEQIDIIPVRPHNSIIVLTSDCKCYIFDILYEDYIGLTPGITIPLLPTFIFQVPVNAFAVSLVNVTGSQFNELLVSTRDPLLYIYKLVDLT